MNFESDNDRPKSLEMISLKLPEELVDDIDFFRGLHRPPKTRSEYVKEACEFVGIIKHGLRVGLYKLREFEKKLNT